MSQDMNAKYSLSRYQEDGDYSDTDFKPYPKFYDDQSNFNHQNLSPTFHVEPDYSGYYQDQINVNLCTAVPIPNCCHPYCDHGYNLKRRDAKRANHRTIQDHDHIHKRAPNVKRYPITVGAPKYYKKPTGANALLKKPSTLCLPLASQQDPETLVRKQKKHNVHECMHQQSLANNKEPELPPHEMDSQGDVTVKIPNLNELLKMFENEDLPQEIKSKSDLTKIAKFLKPKVPSSVKAKLKATKFSESKTADQKVAEVLDDSLEKLLSQLKKCSEAGNERSDKPVVEDKSENQRDGAEKPSQTQTKSFNYEDITNKMKRKSSTESVTSIQNITDKLANSLSSATSTGKPRSQAPRPPLDDHCALELHRSKSYIVSLIDRALSKELGTVPGERTRRKFDDMTPKKAASTLNRHSTTNSCRSDKDLTVEITTALTDSIISNATAPTAEDNQAINEDDEEIRSFKSRVCCCNTEEPSYIKQLKQLRWGHLKHIQREVRRLEDLERFLDSCSMHTIPEM